MKRVSPREILAKELATFERMKPELLASSFGKWALIKGDRLVGIFDSREAAVVDGCRKLGDTDFLTIQVLEREEPVFMPMVVIAD